MEPTLMSIIPAKAKRSLRPLHRPKRLVRLETELLVAVAGVGRESLFAAERFEATLPLAT